jgi:hypothetical protein
VHDVSNAERLVASFQPRLHVQDYRARDYLSGILRHDPRAKVLIRQRAELDAREQVSRIAHEAAGCKLLQGTVQGFCDVSPSLPHQRPRGKDRIGANRRDELKRKLVTLARQVLVEQPTARAARCAGRPGRAGRQSTHVGVASESAPAVCVHVPARE